MQTSPVWLTLYVTAHNYGSYIQWVKKGTFYRIFRILSEDFDRSVVSVDGTILEARTKASGSEKGALALHGVDSGRGRKRTLIWIDRVIFVALMS